ncbi:hypothetical protein NNJEOMEG_00554 [Fundidesulfovibrio magnetotacticus]|uniref:Uncharacterized protein n=1 Tax=Fundidesulfovibrio magnetotacticus TaxID=2730080 RepID=A0A6V8LSY1_9BACT|nr:hypothetical protein [Fundidesulfovibrio magnetotacticus]GFK92727.1 hypothetical protein NNJEOMEG_00554 [Fundidesulfovibrio magnetotacticus]
MDTQPVPVRRPAVVQALILVLVCLALAGCAAKNAQLPPGTVKVAMEPAGFPQAAVTPEWDAAAVRATQNSAGYDFTRTKLLPVVLVLKNKGPGQPQVLLEDVRGVAKDAEYLVYSPGEAMRLAMAKLPLSDQAKNMFTNGAKGAAIGAAIGTGFGLLAYLFSPVKDPALIWTGTIFGGSAGTIVGVASHQHDSREMREIVRADLQENVWNEDPIPPGATRTGYIFLPEGMGIESLRVTVRNGEGEGMTVRELPVALPQDYRPDRPQADQTPAAAETAPAKAPAKAPESELPAPKKVPRQQNI